MPLRFRRHLTIVMWLSVCAAVVALAAGARYTNEVSISESGDFRTIESNGIPGHPTGAFPNPNNPNSISPQRYRYRVAMHPIAAESATPVRMNCFGVALNGVPFDPAAAEWFDRDPQSGWQYEPLSGFLNLGVDENNAHVQPNGAYHYHGAPTGLIDALDHHQGMILVGYAADGFPVYALYGYERADDAGSAVVPMQSSYRLKRGTRPDGPGGPHDGTFVEDWEYLAGAGDLDECNGRYGVTPEFQQGTYYYVVTPEFPFVPRRWRGTPDDSFFKRGPRPGDPHMRGGFPPPPNFGPPPRD